MIILNDKRKFKINVENIYKIPVSGVEKLRQKFYVIANHKIERFIPREGINGIKEVITSCRAAFEHLNVTIEDMIAEGDNVAARFTAHGIHKGDFMGLPATEKTITMTGIEIFRIKDGKIVELWGEANLLGLMQQLRNFPSPGNQG